MTLDEDALERCIEFATGADADQLYGTDGIGDGGRTDPQSRPPQGTGEEDDVVGKPSFIRMGSAGHPAQSCASNSAFTSASRRRPSAPSIRAMSS